MTEPMKNTVVLKQHHFTTQEADIPVKDKRPPVNKHRGSLIIDYKQEKILKGLINQEIADKNGSELDGFFFLEKTESSFPEVPNLNPKTLPQP